MVKVTYTRIENVVYLNRFFNASVVLLKIDNVMTKFDRRIKTDKSTFPIWETIQEVLSKTFLKDVMSLMSCGL